MSKEFTYDWDVEDALREKVEEAERLEVELNKAQAEIRRLHRVINDIQEEELGIRPRDEKYTLEGVDGNAFCIMAYTAKALKNEGLGNLVDQMYEEAKSGSYTMLVIKCMTYLDKANAKAREKEN